MGIDVGTQSFKATVMDENRNIVYWNKLEYDTEFSNYQTKNGVYYDEVTKEARVPLFMVQIYCLQVSHICVVVCGSIGKNFGRYGSRYDTTGEVHLGKCTNAWRCFLEGEQSVVER